MKFTIPIDPVPKGRPRLGRGGRVFTPKRTKDFERTFQLLAHPYRPAKPLEGPLSIEVDFYLRPLKTVKRDFPTTGADLDNYLKAIGDAMNGIFWVDDAQIVEIRCRKSFSVDKNSRIVISIESMEKVL